MALAAHDPGLQRRGDAAVAGEILGDHRLLEPVGIELVDAMAGLDGGVGVPAHVDVDHDLYAAAHRLAHRLDVLHVLAPRPDVRHLHLDGLQSLRGELPGARDHAVAPEAAETARAVGGNLGACRAPQSKQRQAGPLADDVPQRHVDGALGEHRDAHAAQPEVALVERLPDRLDLGCVAADDMRRDQLLHAGIERVQPAAQRHQVAHADEAALGLDLEHIDVAKGRREDAGGRRFAAPRHLQQGGAQLDDRCGRGHKAYLPRLCPTMMPPS